MSNPVTNLFAAILLLTIFFLALFGIKDDAFTFDETAHVASGFSYLTQKDYRLNPEHPPLIKDLSAFPLLFLNLNFPKDDPSWVQEKPPQWWFQFDFGSQFLYRSGNNPDQILFWSKLPMILVLVFLGWFLFFWTRKLFGNKPALLALFLFAFSPTFLAHGRLVTTDIGSALGVVLATYFWLKFLENPLAKNIILAGLIFGLSMLLKFNLILLIPFFAIITLIYAWLNNAEKPLFNKKLCGGLTSTLQRSNLSKCLSRQILKYFGFSLLIGIIGTVFVIWPVYQYHVLNYPPEQQIRDTQFLLSGTSVPKTLVNLNLSMVESPILRPFSQYLLGLLLAINRSTTGHTTYFLGEISARGWKSYFPTVYSIKETLTFHILTIIVLLYFAWLIKKPFWQETFKRTKEWAKNHFPEFAMLVFIAIYWATSLNSKLNIGVRHLLPVFPFTILLVSYGISLWLKEPFLKLRYVLLFVLVAWQIFSVVKVYPHFLSYFNELVGGPDKGYIYVVDSNLDWGQDLKRLKNWMEENKIDKIYLDYFGGGDARYYLGETFLPWWGKRDPKELPKGSYLAVSVSQLQGGRGVPASNFDQPTDYYMWLYQYEPPIKKIGYSIFIYYIE